MPSVMFQINEYDNDMMMLRVRGR